jgi:hypothetical protein
MHTNELTKHLCSGIIINNLKYKTMLLKLLDFSEKNKWLNTNDYLISDYTKLDLIKIVSEEKEEIVENQTGLDVMLIKYFFKESKEKVSIFFKIL